MSLLVDEKRRDKMQWLTVGISITSRGNFISASSSFCGFILVQRNVNDLCVLHNVDVFGTRLVAQKLALDNAPFVKFPIDGTL